MSKTRTGRKGRARLALAGYLNGAGAARTSADSDADSVLLDKLVGQARGQGASGQLFAEGELRGPLPDSVCTDDGAPNMFVADESAGGGSKPLDGDVSGETGIANDAHHTGLAIGPFKHHYFQHKATSSADALALSQASPLTSTQGIIYLPSGPAADFIPANHGCAQNDFYAVSIRPDLSTLVGANEQQTLTNIRYTILGDTTNVDIAGNFSTHTVATAAHKIASRDKMLKAGGQEIRVIGESAQTLLSIKFLDDGDADPADASKTITAAAAGTATNYIVSSATQLYLLAGNDSDVGSDADMCTNIKAAVGAWNAVYGYGVTVAGSGTTLTWSMNRLKGATGNNASDVKGAALTVTGFQDNGLSGDQQAQVAIDQANDATNRWMTATGGGLLDHIKFSGGVTEADNSFNTGPAADVQFTHTDGRYVGTDCDVTVKYTGAVTTSCRGIAVVWSLD